MVRLGGGCGNVRNEVSLRRYFSFLGRCEWYQTLGEESAFISFLDVLDEKKENNYERTAKGTVSVGGAPRARRRQLRYSDLTNGRTSRKTFDRKIHRTRVTIRRCLRIENRSSAKRRWRLVSGSSAKHLSVARRTISARFR